MSRSRADHHRLVDLDPFLNARSRRRFVRQLRRIREVARGTMEQIRTNTPVPVEMSQLRDELERLKRDQETLRARLTKYEKVEPKNK